MLFVSIAPYQYSDQCRLPASGKFPQGNWCLLAVLPVDPEEDFVLAVLVPAEVPAEVPEVAPEVAPEVVAVVVLRSEEVPEEPEEPELVWS